MMEKTNESDADSEKRTEEVRNARRWCNNKRGPVSDVTRRSVEETAAGILQYYNIWCERQ